MGAYGVYSEIMLACFEGAGLPGRNGGPRKKDNSQGPTHRSKNTFYIYFHRFSMHFVKTMKNFTFPRTPTNNIYFPICCNLATCFLQLLWFGLHLFCDSCRCHYIFMFGKRRLQLTFIFKFALRWKNTKCKCKVFCGFVSINVLEKAGPLHFPIRLSFV